MSEDEEHLIISHYAQASNGLTDSFFKANNFRPWYSYVLSLDENTRYVYLIMILNDQVLNGGFHQYFTNTYGLFAYETIVALNAIGCPDIADLLAEAVNLIKCEDESPDTFRKKIFLQNYTCLYEDDFLWDSLDAMNNFYENQEYSVLTSLSSFIS